MWKFIKERLSEKSTWLTLATLIGTVGGIQVSPELSEGIATAGLSILTLIGILTKEKK